MRTEKKRRTGKKRKEGTKKDERKACKEKSRKT